MSDHKAEAWLLVDGLSCECSADEVAICAHMGACQRGAVTIAEALSAAEARGLAKGLREAREIASGQFGWDVSVWLDMTKKDMTRLMAEAIVSAIDAALVNLERE